MKRRVAWALLLLLIASRVGADDFSERTKSEVRRLFTPGNATDDSVMLGNGSTWDIKAVPDCTDASGNHLNYTAASNSFSCGTSSSSPSGSGTGNTVTKWTGATTLGNSSISDDGSTISSAEPIRLGNGLISAPSFSFTGDTQTGIWRSGSNLLDFAVGGVQVMQFRNDYVYIGDWQSSAASGTNSEYDAVNGSGSNNAGQNVFANAGRSTGNANGGNYTIRITPPGASGSALNTRQVVFQALGASGAVNIGGVNALTPGASVWAGNNAATGQTDTAGGTVTVAGGKGTGTAGGGNVVWQATFPAAATASTQNALQNVIVTSTTTGSLTMGGINFSGSGALGTSTFTGVNAASGVSNKAGGGTTIATGVGTGSASAPTLSLQVAPNAGSGTTQNTAKNVFSATGTGYTLGGTAINSGGTAPSTSTVNGYNAAGTDVAGGALTIGTGAGTGSAAAPSLTLQVYPNAATGSALNTAKTVFVATGSSFTLGSVTINSGGTAPAASSIQGYNAAGTDVAGGELDLNGGTPTGAGAAGSVLIKVAPNQATGTTAGTLATAATFSGTAVTVGNYSAVSGGTAVAANTYGGVNAAGSDKAGTNTSLLTGDGTGAGAPGDVLLRSSAELATSSTAQTAITRYLVRGPVKSVPNNTATSVLDLTLASGSNAGATVNYCVEVKDASDFQTDCGVVAVACVNKAGTFTNNASVLGTDASARSAGTLAVTWDFAATSCTLRVNANSSLTPSAGYPRIRYGVAYNGSQAITPQ